MDDFIKKIEKVEEYINNEVKKDIGVQAVNFYKRSFQNEGFTDKKLEKWKEVKRRENPKIKVSASKRKILTGESKQLADSIEYNISGNSINITTDVIYAQIHNEGGKAGINGSAEIPKRQFIGHSDSLDKIVFTEIESEITKRFND